MGGSPPFEIFGGNFNIPNPSLFCVITFCALLMVVFDCLQGVFYARGEWGGDFLNIFKCNWVFEDLILVKHDWPGWLYKKEEAPLKSVMKITNFVL